MASLLGLALSMPGVASGQETPAAGSVDHARAAQCLATAIAYEAGFEPIEGQQAVAEVILNRVRDPLYPKSVCGVVFAGSTRRTGCQFSFTCDGSMRRRLPDRVIASAQAVAEAALAGANPVRVAGATHYHAGYVSPYWAPSLVRITRIGAHIFYRLPGSADRAVLARAFAPSGEPLVAAITGGEADEAAPPAPAPAPPPQPQAAAFSAWGLSVAVPPR